MEKTKRDRKRILEPREYFLSRQRTLLQSFNWAIEGVVFALKTQRNMKIHFAAAFVVLVASLFTDLTRVELIAILFAITMVIVAELFNTAIEVAVDLATNGQESELAKIAKDVAAAGVLISALNSVFVGFLVLFKKFSPLTASVISSISRTPEYLTGLAIILVFGVSIVFKIMFGEGTPFRGGWPSIHGAVAGSLLTSITIVSRSALAGALAFFMAVLVLQARVEKQIHTWFEVVSGFIIGIFITILLFQLFYF